MTSKWRKDTKETFITKKPIIEGAEFAIFDNSYWDGKDQLQMENANTKIIDVINNIRDTITYPLTLINEATDNIIFTFLSVFVEKDPLCNTSIKEDDQNKKNQKISGPLIDTNLLWISESFRNLSFMEAFTEGLEDGDADNIDATATAILNNDAVAIEKVRQDSALIPAIMQTGSVSRSGSVSGSVSGLGQQIGQQIGLGQQSVSGQQVGGVRQQTSGQTLGNTEVKKIGGVVLPTNSIDIDGLQQLIAEFQENHLGFMKDNDVYYSIRNKVATYYMQQLSNYETKQKKYLDVSGIFDFNNNFDNNLNDPSIQMIIKNIKLDFKKTNTLTYSLDLGLENGLQGSILQKYSYIDYSNNLHFLNQIAIYLIQQKTNYEKDKANYNFYTSYNFSLENLPIQLIKNITLPSEKNLWLTFKTSNVEQTSIPNKITEDSNCINGFSKSTYSDIQNITQLVKSQLINIVFIPMLILIIYNVYYFLCYKDCYNENCSSYNEFPKLEEWIFNMLGITRENQPTFIFDFLFDLFFKPIKFIYTFFNSIKPTIMEWNNSFPYLFFVGLVAIITPLFMQYRNDIIKIISSILFLQLPDANYSWYSVAIISASLFLVFLQRIWGILFIRNQTDPDGNLKPRLWAEWISGKTEKVPLSPFSHIARGIFTVLYWVFKGLATWSIVSLSVYPIVLYTFFVGLFGIWNNSKDGFNPQFNEKSGEKWQEINDFIFKKLLEPVNIDDSSWYTNIKNAGKNFLSFIILFLSELIIIGILMTAMGQYGESSILTKYSNIRNVLFISNAVIIGIILGWCGMKWFSTYTHYFEKMMASPNINNNFPLPEYKTFINIWKQALDIESFL